MRNGTITHWDESKGYGFITPDDSGHDVFFHISTWRAYKRPHQGQRVSFEHEVKRDMSLAATHVICERTPLQTSLSKWWQILVSSIILLSLLIFFWPDIRQHLFPQPDATVQTIIGDIQIDRTLARIRQGGPFPYPHKDGRTFYNREHRLPVKPVGYYREYTVPAENTGERGAKRIVTGGHPPEVYYYTPDHYRHFMRLDVR